MWLAWTGKTIKISDYHPKSKKFIFLIHSSTSKQHEIPILNSAPSNNGKKDLPTHATIHDFVNKLQPFVPFRIPDRNPSTLDPLDSLCPKCCADKTVTYEKDAFDLVSRQMAQDQAAWQHLDRDGSYGPSHARTQQEKIDAQRPTWEEEPLLYHATSCLICKST